MKIFPSLILLLCIILLITSAVIIGVRCTFKEAFSDPNLKIITFFTKKHCDEWRNLMKSLDILNLKKYVVVYCLDKGSYKCARNENVKTVQMFTNIAEEANFSTLSFQAIMIEKIRMIVEELKNGIPLLYLDTDVVVLKNPFPHLKQLTAKDVYLQSDMTDGRTSDITNYCAGCMYILPTYESERLFTDTLNLLEKNHKKQKQNGAKNYKNYADQDIINEIIKKRPELNVETLDPIEFPNGVRYFDHLDKYPKGREPFLVHNNWIVGLKKKIERFKKHNLWFLHDVSKLVLITQYYFPKWPERKKEIDICLQKNLDNPMIRKVLLFTESHIPSSYFKNFRNAQKIRIQNIGKRLTYKDVVTTANRDFSGEICILANSDIYFDKTLKNIDKFDLTTSVLCLSRYEVLSKDSYRRFDCNDQTCCTWSQDTWIFKSPLTLLSPKPLPEGKYMTQKKKNEVAKLYNKGIQLGTFGCEHVWAFILKISGYKILNPCIDIKTYHLHSNFKQRGENNTYKPDNREDYFTYLPSMYENYKEYGDINSY